MKVRGTVRRMCEFCRTVQKKGRTYIYCSNNPKHKQRTRIQSAEYTNKTPKFRPTAMPYWCRIKESPTDSGTFGKNQRTGQKQWKRFFGDH